MNQATFVLTIILILLIAGCANRNSEENKFSFNPEANKTYNISLSRLSTTIEGKHRYADTLNLDGALTLLAKDDSTSSMRFEFYRLQYKTTMSTVTMTATLPNGRKRTSTVNFAAERDSLLRLIQGMSVVFTITNKGQLRMVEKVDELIDSIAQSAKLEVSTVRLRLRSYLSAELLKDIFNPVFYTLPAKPVKPGEAWGNEFNLNSKAPVHLSNMYTLNAKSDDTARLQTHSLVAASLSEGGRVYMKGKVEGVAMIDWKSGLPFQFNTVTTTVTTTDQYESKDKKHEITRTEKQNVLIRH